MKSYYNSLPINQKKGQLYLSDVIINLNKTIEEIRNIDVVDICNQLFEEDHSKYIQNLVNRILSKISRAGRFLKMESGSTFNDESEELGLCFLYLWSTLNDIFFLRYNLLLDKWLVVDSDKNIKELIIFNENIYEDKLIFTGSLKNIQSLNQARDYFHKVIEAKINPEKQKDYNDNQINEIEFIRHLIGIYYTELILVFRECRFKRNHHELIHGRSIINKHHSTNFYFEDILKILNIISTLLFLN